MVNINGQKTINFAKRTPKVMKMKTLTTEVAAKVITAKRKSRSIEKWTLD